MENQQEIMDNQPEITEDLIPNLETDFLESIFPEGDEKSDSIKIKYILAPKMKAKLPTKSYESSAGYDIYLPSALGRLELKPYEESSSPITLGLKIKIPNGYFGFIHSRSGLACKMGVEVIGAPTVIDPDFTGTLAVHLRNTTGNSIHLREGAKIAQLIIQKRFEIDFIKVDELPKTERGSKSFGSTGI